MTDDRSSAVQGSPSGESLVPDFDQLPITALGNRIRSLNEGQLRQLLTYESAHRNSPQVLDLLRARIDRLRADGAPSDHSTAPKPGPPPGHRGGAKASPATAARSGNPSRGGAAGPPRSTG